MARTSYKSFLMHSADGKVYEKLVDIKEYPDLGKAPDTIDVTTLSDGQKMYLPDIFDPGALEFNCNYDLDDYKKLKELEGKDEHYAVWFGGVETAGVLTPDGSAGKYAFDGQLSVWVKGAGVSAAVDMGVSITATSEIKLVEGATA